MKDIKPRHCWPASAAVCSALLLVCSVVHAEEPNYRFESVRTIPGPSGGDSGNDLAVDANGAVFVVGHHGGLDFDNDGLAEVESRGLTDPLIIESGPTGDAKWVTAPGGPEYDTGEGIAPDHAGGAYVVGSFKRDMRFRRSGETIVSGGSADGYLARYDTDGEPLWARVVGGAGDDSLRDVATDSKGNVYVVGTIRGEIDLDHDGTTDLTTSAEAGLLLASFDRDGTLRWARASAGQGGVFGRAIALGPQSDTFVAGFYRTGDVDLDNDGRTDLPAAPEDGDSFLARFNADGALSWTRSVSGPDAQSISALAFAGNGDLLVTGTLEGSVDFDGDGTPDANVGTGGRNIFLARFTVDGELVWVRTFAARNAWHVAADEERIVLSGLYKGPLDLDGNGEQDGEADPDGKSEGFVAILDNDGGLQHVFTIVGPGHDQARAAGFSPDGEALFVTGFVRLTADFDSDGIVEQGVRCDGLGDIFFARYDVKE